MSKTTKTLQESLYGLPQPLLQGIMIPFVAKRDPTAADKGFDLGQLWINKVGGTVWGLTTVAAGTVTWLSLGGSITPAVASITTGAVATSSLLAGDTLTATGTNGNIGFILVPKGNGGVTIATGPLSMGDGNIALTTIGNGLEIATGVNARMGTSAAMVAGVIAVANTSVTANTKVFLSPDTAGGTQGALSVVTAAGVGFTITSSNALDTSTVNWLLIEAI